MMSEMMGKLSMHAIPMDNPIIMGAVGGSLLLGLVILALITWHRKWGYLWTEWFTSVDHKRIGVMYVILALIMLLRGFADAIMMRAQQAIAVGDSTGYLPPGHFAEIFSAHGTIMIIFMLMPFLVGLFNIVVPQQIGARDVAFPFLNSMSFWLTAMGAALIMVSLAVGNFSEAGWTGYPPFSELATQPSTGVDYWIWAIQLSGLGTLLTGVNFMVTILKMRAPGMTLMRMPVFVWTTLVTCILIILSFPVITVTLALLALDRYLEMHFFTNAMGGNMMMYANLFWIWGHPEVYILILPAFGVFSEVVPTFSRKTLFGYKTMVWATAAIGILSFTVWMHHFFTMGSNADVNAVFGITTMIIAVPTGVKIFNWLFTMYKGRVHFTNPIRWTIGFFSAFTLGGMTGVLQAVPPADFMVHNSLFLVAHFHNMLLPGALFAFLAGYEYWFPKAFGFRLNETWGKRAFWFWLSGFYTAFMPLYVLGFMGMPRRMSQYWNEAWHPWLIIAAIGAVLILIGIVCLAVQLTVSIRDREKLSDLTGDPWNGRTLEWATASPPADYNFPAIPVVHGLDAFWEMKRDGTAYKRPERYSDIVMPRNTPAGFVIGILAFVFAFALIWHMWLIAIVSALGTLLTVMVRSFNDDIEYVIPAAEVERTEQARFKRMEQARQAGEADTADSDQQPVPQV